MADLSELFKNMSGSPWIQPLPKKTVRFSPSKPKVFVSFDYENDRNYRNILSAWNANTSFQFTFQDFTPLEIQSNSVSTVKAVLTRKVREATHTLLINGAYANELHRDRAQIGFDNWISFEVAQSIINQKNIVAVRLDNSYAWLKALKYCPSNKLILIDGFNRDRILEALRK